MNHKAALWSTLPMAVAAALFALPSRAADLPPNAVWLESLDLNKMSQDYGKPHAGKSVDNNPLTLGGTTFEHGVGTHATSEMLIDLKGAATRFSATVGVDDEKKGTGSVDFVVYVDGKKAADSGVLKGGDAPKKIDVDLTGAKHLTLRVTDADNGIDSDHGDWADAMIVMAPAATVKPEATDSVPAPPPIIASGNKPEPAIHGPRVTGATPGYPFLFLIPATGQGPLTYSATGLPAGLKLDARTGIISGTIAKAGISNVQLTVRGARGIGTRRLRIVAGPHKLAQTPPMGWNSWNIFYCSVDEAKVRSATDWIMKSGLAAHGYQYVNIDDCWQQGRDANGEVTVNKKFGDMKALSDYIHGLGLRFGIYSSPGPKTCAGYEGSYQHEQQDALTYAKWGVDYLKYDWCSYGGIAKGNSLPELQKPYDVMRTALDNAPRDIVFSYCQYGMGDVWTWGTEHGGNLWRTTGDIGPSYGSMSNIGFGQDGHEKYAGPGHWNDPDMLFVHALKPNEQVTHISLWSLLAAPLLIGSDISKLDKFSLDVLSNDEVIDVDQDPLGKAANRRSKDGQVEVWARPLFDGTMAVGLFNRGADAAPVTAKWADLGIKGIQPVRDLWQQKNLPAANGSFTATVPAHGAVLVKIGKPKATEF